MSDKARTVFCFPLCYSRHGTIVQGLDDACDRCAEKVTVVSIDTSDGEYGAIALCKPCILAMFETPPDICQHDFRKGEFDQFEFCVHCGNSAYRVQQASRGAN